MSTMLSYHQTGIIIPSAGKHNLKKKRLDYARFSFGILSDGYNENLLRLTIFWGRSRNPGNPLKKNFFWYWNPGLVDPTT